MSKIKNSATLAEIAGTTRGLSKLTVKQIRALLDGEAPAKVVVKAKPTSEFYEKVIVAGRDERAAHQKGNREAASWMREKGLVPSGQAWAAVKKGERNIKALRALNEADGLKPMVKKAGVTAEVQAETKVAKTRKPKAEAKTEPEGPDPVQALIDGGWSEAEAKEILGR